MSRMPFGKFKGLRLDELSDEYLNWLRGIDLREPLRSEFDAEMRRRGLAGREETALVIPLVDVPLVRKLIDCGIKGAARVHHPDFGGELAVMQRLNGVVGLLRMQLAALEAR